MSRQSSLPDDPGQANGHHSTPAERGAGAVIFEVDPGARRFTYVSGSAERMLGYPLERWLSEPAFWLRILHPADRERAESLWREALERGCERELEYRVLTAQGQVRWVQSRLHVIKSADGQPRLVHGVLTDVTATRETTPESQPSPPAPEPPRAAPPPDAAERMRALATAAAELSAVRSVTELREVLGRHCAQFFPGDAVFLRFAGQSEESAPLPAGNLLQSPVPTDGEPGGFVAIASRSPSRFDELDQAALDVIATLSAMTLVRLHGSSEAAATQRILRGAEALSALLQEATSAAIEARTFNEAAAQCLAAICAYTGWPTAHVFVRTDEGDVVSTGIWELRAQARYREITSVASRIRYRPGIGIVGRVLTTGEPVWVADVTRDPTFLRRSGTGDPEVRGAFAFPVKVGDDVAAVLEFLSRDVVEPDSALIDVCRRIGGQLARVIERERAADRIHFQARLLDAVGQAVIASDVHHRVVYWNQAAEELFGWSREEALGRTDSDVLPARATAQQTGEITSRLAAGQSWSGEFEVRRKDGTTIPVHITGSAIHDDTGAPAGFLGVATDLRQGKDLEQKLRQAQRLEAIGRLAGGVAHDFNNLLTSIKGITLMLLEDLPSEHAMRGDLEEIRRAADRAAALTSQLLAFSRRQILKPRVVSLEEVVRESLPVLRRLLGDPIQLVTELSSEIAPVFVDPAQIGQVIVNLAVNARDAMAAGGRVSIRAANYDPARPSTDLPEEQRANAFVLLEVRDEGTGIPAEEIEHIFEPFYTTKRQGAGIGMGLSTVYGIVKQSEGHIIVHSEPGLGSTFRIYLPAVAREQTLGRPTPTPASRSGSETLLLVEDEESVRRLARKILDRQGYIVLEAANGVEALEVCARHDGRIDLVVSDVVMPHMSGPELIERLQTLRPGLPVLLMSGYTGDALGRADLTASPEKFLEKPFSPDALVSKVRGLLDAVAREAED